MGGVRRICIEEEDRKLGAAGGDRHFHDDVSNLDLFDVIPPGLPRAQAREETADPGPPETSSQSEPEAEETDHPRKKHELEAQERSRMEESPGVLLVEGHPDRSEDGADELDQCRDRRFVPRNGLQNEADDENDNGGDEDGERSPHDESGETTNGRGAPRLPPPPCLLLEEADPRMAGRGGHERIGISFKASLQR